MLATILLTVDNQLPRKGHCPWRSPEKLNEKAKENEYTSSAKFNFLLFINIALKNRVRKVLSIQDFIYYMISAV